MQFEIHSVTPDICSPYGGCDFHLTGVGFDVAERDKLSVTVNGIEAVITSWDDNTINHNTDIKFKLESTSKTHRVKNDGINSSTKMLIIFDEYNL